VVVESARASGRSGERWLEFTYRIADDSGVENLDLDAIQAAHEEGFREYLSTGGGWATRWTTAERAYDYGWTRHITDVGDWHGKTLRRVIIDPDYHLGQEMRYRSGNHGCWAVDPRIEEAEYQARRAADKAEAAARDAKRREGQEWIAALSDEALKALSDDEADKRGLSWEERGRQIWRTPNAPLNGRGVLRLFLMGPFSWMTARRSLLVMGWGQVGANRTSTMRNMYQAA